MQTSNAELMRMARESLKEKWGLAIGAYVVFLLTLMIVQLIPKVGAVLSIIITGPMTVGLNIFFLALSRNQEVKIEQIFEGFERFGTALAAYLWMALFILLWSLLLIVPGIMAAYSYAMTFYVLADDKSIGAREAIAKSKKMMYGNRWKFVFLNLRFFGWALLCVLTLGIGFLWLAPYVQASLAKFYDDIKEKGAATEEKQVAIENTPLVPVA